MAFEALSDRLQGIFKKIRGQSELTEKNMEEVTLEMVGEMVDDSSELISVYFGCDVDEDAAEALSEKLQEAYPDCDVELQMGGQPIYYYVISVE